MSTIKYIPAAEVTIDTTTYIDAKAGVVLSATVGGIDDDEVFLSVDDPNGEREYRFAIDELVPTLG